jgi:hypothetical protein
MAKPLNSWKILLFLVQESGVIPINGNPYITSNKKFCQDIKKSCFALKPLRD